MFDDMIIGVAASPSKNTMFNLDERVELVKQSCGHLTNTSVVGFNGLLVDFAQQQLLNILIRRSAYHYGF